MARGPTLLAELSDQFDQLRSELSETPPPADSDEPGMEPTVKPKRLSLEEFGIILRHGERLDRLATEDQSRFSELLTTAEQKLGDGEYFWAERYFARALRFVPDHPLASAGLAHAQIGAGLPVPAALSLRRLLSSYPEMIDVQYAPNLLPSKVRLNIAVRVIRDRMARQQRDRALLAFLLAYIGHQVDDRALIVEGLDAMAAAERDDPLLPLLRVVWLDEPAADASGE